MRQRSYLPRIACHTLLRNHSGASVIAGVDGFTMRRSYTPDRGFERFLFYFSFLFWNLLLRCSVACRTLYTPFKLFYYSGIKMNLFCGNRVKKVAVEEHLSRQRFEEVHWIPRLAAATTNACAAYVIANNDNNNAYTTVPPTPPPTTALIRVCRSSSSALTHATTILLINFRVFYVFVCLYVCVVARHCFIVTRK